MPRLAVLYTALILAANPAAADPAAWQAALTGEMRRLVAVDPLPVPDTAFTDPAGGEHRLSDWRGKWLLVNFWATWCAPCREEMPGLDALQTRFGGDRFEVVAIATGRNEPAGIRRFLDETGVGLAVHLDPKTALARAAGVLGLPVTLLVDPDGREVARLVGGADWTAPEAVALVEVLVAGQ